MFGSQVETDARNHALDEYPNESCGYVADGMYHRAENISEHPSRSFLMDWKAMGPDIISGNVQAIIHSHPDGPQYPSASDMQSQIDLNVPWGIVPVFEDGMTNLFWFGDQAPIPPLEGRPFRHGVTDCYSLIRDWYRLEKGITLKEYPRNWCWWETGDKLYLDNLEDAGFERMPSSVHPEVGDLFFGAIKSTTVNHAGVYVGQGQILHHLTRKQGYDPTKISRRDTAIRWSSMIQFWARYTGQ